MSEKKAKYIVEKNGKWIVQIQNTKNTNYYRQTGFKSLEEAIEHRDYILAKMAKGKKVVPTKPDDHKYIIRCRGKWAVAIQESKKQNHKQYWKSGFETKAAAKKHRDQILAGENPILDDPWVKRLKKHKDSSTHGIRKNKGGSYRLQMQTMGAHIYVNRNWENKKDAIVKRNEIIDQLVTCKSCDEVKKAITKFHGKKLPERNNLHEGSYITPKISAKDGKKRYGIYIRSILDKKTKFSLTRIDTFDEAKEIRDWMLEEIDSCETIDDLLSFKKTLREFSESRKQYGKGLEKSLPVDKTKVELSEEHLDLVRKSSVSGYHARATVTEDWRHFENIRGAIEYVVGNHPKAAEYREHLINLRSVKDEDVSKTEKN